MTGRVTLDLPMADYQATKAVSASFIHTLVEECPAKAWQASPWNPQFEAETRKEFDIGAGLHLAILDPHLQALRIVEIDAENFKTKAAQQARDDAYAQGLIPLLEKDRDMIDGMRRAIHARPDVLALFCGGDAEVSLFWDWDGIPCKARPDYLNGNNGTIVDLKTAISANPKAIARKAFAEGWHVRSEWYLEAVNRCAWTIPMRYVYVVVEKDPPHLIVPYELDSRSLAWGKQIITRGMRIAQQCFETGEWPGYGPAGVAPLSLPTWAEYRLADDEDAAARELMAP